MYAARTWQVAGTGTEDAGGRVEFTAPYSSAGPALRYRAVAAKTRTLPPATSGVAATNAWGPTEFADEFSGTDLAWPWEDRLQGYIPARSCARADASARAVSGGVLTLRVIDDPDRDDACVLADGSSYFYRLNGHVGTQGRHSFRYGVAAARIRFHDRKGQHGAFWLQPDHPASSGGDPAVSGAEIDVIEGFGNSTRWLASTVYSYVDGVQVKTGGWIGGDLARFGADWAEKYHVFSMEWTPQVRVWQ